MQDAQGWAEDEFGEARMGDARRTRRLVELASEAAARPAGTVTQVYATSASREGAFRLLENAAVKLLPIADCVREATLRRCGGHSRVFVAVDATSLHLTDEKQAKGIGSIGSVNSGARGVHAMTALAVSDDGVPLGIVGQKLWVRKSRSRRREGGRPKHGGESAFWRKVLDECSTHFLEGAATTTPWYQLDRGGDCWQVLSHASDNAVLLTVRATHDRCLDGAKRLWQTVERAPVLATTLVEVPAKRAVWRKQRVAGKRRAVLSAARPARHASLSIRAATVSLQLTTPDGRQLRTFNAVLARERRRSSANRVEWLLLTTHPIATRSDVLAVVRGYSMRWRIEDFHRLWKRGLCNVEDTQLRSQGAIYKWVTLLAAVATRAQRLAHQARITPQAPATSEFKPAELTALLCLRSSSGPPPDPFPLHLAVRWLAELGGYIGPWNGPPGPTVIGRGLYDLHVAVRVLKHVRKKK